MKTLSWDDCLKTGMAKYITPDPERALALTETALARLQFLNKADQNYPNFIFEGQYTSIVELFHAFMLKVGIKVENHLCVGHYLKEIIHREDLFNIFNDCRHKRNLLVYYGKRMNEDIAKESMQKAEELINGVRKLLEPPKSI